MCETRDDVWAPVPSDAAGRTGTRLKRSPHGSPSEPFFPVCPFPFFLLSLMRRAASAARAGRVLREKKKNVTKLI